VTPTPEPVNGHQSEVSRGSLQTGETQAESTLWSDANPKPGLARSRRSSVRTSLQFALRSGTVLQQSTLPLRRPWSECCAVVLSVEIA